MNKEKVSSVLGSNNPNWKGELVKKAGLHVWVTRYLKKPDLCECCGIVPPLDLANKGIYDRNFENWEWLCRKCHMTKDGRMNNLKRVGGSTEILCKVCGSPRKVRNSQVTKDSKYCSHECYVKDRWFL
jgi:hypothetical protein